MKLQNKIIVITGASDGIGKQITLRLAKEKTKLALIARDKKRLSETASEALNLGAADVKTYTIDLKNTQKLENISKKIITEFGGVNILINNAGIWQKMMPIDEIERQTVDEVIQTNLLAPIHLTRLLLPVLRQQKEAAIINVISKSGIVAQLGQSVYTASKYGLRGFTEVLRADLKNTNIKIAGIYQDGTNTNMFKKAKQQVDTNSFTEPADLADVVAYILTRPPKLWLQDVFVSK